MNQEKEERKRYVRNVAQTFCTLKGAEEGRLSEVVVAVEQVRPVLEGENGDRQTLPERVELVITRGKRSTSFRVAEAKTLRDLIDNALPTLLMAEKKMRDQKKAWDGEQRYTPKRNEDFSMGRGKTERQRKKGKARSRTWDKDKDGNRSK